MAYRRPKIDNRQFSKIPKKEGNNKWGEGTTFKKRKKCLLCGQMFTFQFAKELYCGSCKKKIGS
jgi:hypothetical protein